MLRTATVEDSTLGLLKKLQQLPLLKDLRLVGGTALALQLGHRHSIDLDFFGKIEEDSAQIVNQLNSNGFEAELKYDTKKDIKVFLINGVKVDMVNYSYEWIDESIEDEGVRMGSLKDIAAMKLSAVTNRGTKKDFIDVYTLLKHFSLKEMLHFYEQKYPHASIYNVIRSLCYFEDAEANPMPKMFVAADWEEIKLTIQAVVSNELNS
jgi:predicted nucleotidyltransferase component of viral defense system